jgi:hypothetical protein
MKRDQIIKFFKHVAGREASHGIQDAFRFKAILSSRKQGSMHPARYNDTTTEPAPAPARRRKKKVPVQNPQDIQQQPSSGMTPAPAGTTDPALPPACQQKTKAPVKNVQQQTSSFITMAPHSTMMTTAPTYNMFNFDILPSQETATITTLTLDPAFNVDPPLQLDPSLDPGPAYMSSFPSVEQPATTCASFLFAGDAGPELTVPDVILQHWVESQSDPAPALPGLPMPEQVVQQQDEPAPAPAPANVSRRRGMNADRLAIQEAEKYAASGKRRH